MTYKSTWQLPGHNPPMLVQLSIAPYGANGAASFRISSCVPKKAPSPTIFPSGEVLRLTQPDGDRIVVQKYLDWIAANPGAIPLFDNNNGLFPEYFLEPQGRRKTATELLLDEAMLRVELGDYEIAQTLLNSVVEPSDCMFHHTVLRRLYANWATDAGGALAQVHAQQAVQHAEVIVDIYRKMESLHEYPNRYVCYYFGDYSTAGSQVSSACATLATHRLQQRQYQAALEIVEYGISANCWDSDLRELQIRALVAMDRNEEVWPIYALNHRGIGPMPEVTETEGYRAYMRAQSEEAQTKEKKRRASVVLRYHDSPLLADTEQAAWRARYPNLPQDFLSWVSSGQSTHLRGSVETDEYEYRLFNLQQSNEWHTDFMGWLNLHAKSSPDFHAEIWKHIHASGIDPERMAPILGDTHTPDGFLVRCDGGTGEYGAVYFWSHEELPVFEKIANNAQELMPWLATAMREGKPFIL